MLARSPCPTSAAVPTACPCSAPGSRWPRRDLRMALVWTLGSKQGSPRHCQAQASTPHVTASLGSEAEAPPWALGACAAQEAEAEAEARRGKAMSAAGLTMPPSPRATGKGDTSWRRPLRCQL